MRILLGWPAWVGAQVLLVGRGVSPDGKLIGIDTIFRFESPPAVLHISYRVPNGYEQDTFLILVRNALAPLAWISLPPLKGSSPFRQARLQLQKGGIYGLFLYAKGKGSRVWAFKRLYILLPPYQTLAQAKAYHNALLAKRPPTPPPLPATPETPPLPEPSEDPLLKALPLSNPVDIPLPQEELLSLDDISLSPVEEPANIPSLEEEDLTDDP